MTRQQSRSFIILGGLLLYYGISFYLIRGLGAWNYNFLMKPLLATGLSVYLYRLGKIKATVSLKYRPLLLFICALAGVAFVLTHMLLGIVEGFGKNPYDVSLKGVLCNLWSYYPFYLVLEMLRERILNTVREPSRKVVLCVVVMAYSLFDFTPTNLMELFQNNVQQNVEFVGSKILPSIALNTLLSYIVIWGGWIPALVVKLLYVSMFFFFSVLPDLEWLTQAFVNILFPVSTLYLVADLIGKRDTRKTRRSNEKEENPLGTIVTYLVSIVIVWFSVGVFPVFPTLVLTGSMEPLIKPGDVVIMKRVDPEEIAIGDIIQFHETSYDIVHRVIDIKDSQFQTKGDNNNTADSGLVNPGFVRGRYMFHVPSIGKLTLYLKSEWSSSRLKEVEQDYELGSE